MPGSDQTPGEWPISATQGDSLIPTDFTLTADGSPLVPVTAIAQVRETKSRAATLVLALTCDIAANVVTVGDGDSLTAIEPGTFWCDLQITNTAYPSGLTVVGGNFRVVADVSEVIV